MRKATVAAIAPAALLVSLLAGCGSDDEKAGGSTDDYCDVAKGIKDDVESIDFSTLDDKTFNQLQDNFDKLEASAPDDVQKDWALLSDKFAELDGILDDAGISFDQLQSIESGQMPDGMDMAKAQEFITKMQDWTKSAADVEPAVKRIETNLKDDCGIDTEESGS